MTPNIRMDELMELGEQPIRLTIGIGDEVDHMPMDFWIYARGVDLGSEFTRNDLRIAKAVLLDLADALDKKLAEMVN